MAKRFSQETKEKARTMRLSGMSYIAIAQEIGCTNTCVRYWCDWKARAENQQRMSVNTWTRSSKMEVAKQDKDITIALYAFVAQYNEQHGTDYEIDHINSVHLGGTHSIDNLRILPRRANRTGRPKRK